MAREYVIQTWVKHDIDDHRVIPKELLEATRYSGEQIGDRKLSSHGNTYVRGKAEGWLANGQADTSYYPDQDEVFRDNPLFKIDPAFKQLALYQDQVVALDRALNEKTISADRHAYALRVLDAKITKAEQKLDKLAYGEIEEEFEFIPQYVETRQEYLLPDYSPTALEKAIAVHLYNENLLKE